MKAERSENFELDDAISDDDDKLEGSKYGTQPGVSKAAQRHFTATSSTQDSNSDSEDMDISHLLPKRDKGKAKQVEGTVSESSTARNMGLRLSIPNKSESG